MSEQTSYPVGYERVETIYQIYENGGKEKIEESHVTSMNYSECQCVDKYYVPHSFNQNPALTFESAERKYYFKEWFEDGIPKHKITYYPDWTIESQEWFSEAGYHREDGPAKILYYPDGKVRQKNWFLNGRPIKSDSGSHQINYDFDGNMIH